MTPDRASEAKKAIIIGAGGLPQPAGARCARCQKPVKEDGHGGFCSQSCSQAEGEELSQSKLRELVFARDQGFCAVCTMNTEDVRKTIAATRADAEHSSPVLHVRGRKDLSARIHQLVRLGFPRGPVERGESLWQADHINPRVKGGPTTIENARSLCLACHKKATSALSSSRAAARKPRRSFGR